MNPANAATAARIALVPPFAVCMYVAAEGEPGSRSTGRWLAAGLFAVASLTDYLDGYLARKMSAGTELGEWLDPLADKILVGAALVTLVAFRSFPLWAALVIAAREVAVALLRSAAVRRGRSMPAWRAAKLKTAVQIPMVFVWILDREGIAAVMQDVVLATALALTLFSGAQYFSQTQKLLGPRR